MREPRDVTNSHEAIEEYRDLKLMPDRVCREVCQLFVQSIGSRSIREKGAQQGVLCRKSSRQFALAQKLVQRDFRSSSAGN